MARNSERWYDLTVSVQATDGNTYIVYAYRVTRSADIQTEIENTLVLAQRNEYTTPAGQFVPKVGGHLRNEHETVEKIVSVTPLYSEDGGHVDRYRITTDQAGI